MRALIVSGRGVQDQEMAYPFYRLQGAGYEVTVAGPDHGHFIGIQGVKFFANAQIMDEAEVEPDYDMLVIPGGVKCMEHLRLNQAALCVVQSFYACRRGVIAAICSGAQMLISAKIVKGRRIAAYPAMRVDVENAGAKFVDEPAVVDGRFVTSTHYDHLGPWMEAALKTNAALFTKTKKGGRKSGWTERGACAAAGVYFHDSGTS